MRDVRNSIRESTTIGAYILMYEPKASSSLGSSTRNEKFIIHNQNSDKKYTLDPK